MIIWETWLEEKATLINNNYDCFQTKYSKYQGVAIIIKRNWVQKVFTNNEPYIIGVQANFGKNITFFIGAYLKENSKDEILKQIKDLIQRIKKSYENPLIIVYEDFNTNNQNFSIDYIEKTIKLKSSIMNKSTITREQKREVKINKSTLDYFLTNLNPTTLEIWEGGGSDHKPIVSDMNVPNITTRKREKFTINKSIIPSVNTINKILDNKQWPTIRISNEEATGSLSRSTPSDRQLKYNPKLIRYSRLEKTGNK